jgi:hypothetical protein
LRNFANGLHFANGRRIASGSLPPNPVFQRTNNGEARRKRGNIKGSKMAKNKKDSKGPVSKIVSNYTGSVDSVFSKMKELSVHSKVIRYEKGEKARPSVFSDKEALTIAANDMDGIANNDEIMEALEELEEDIESRTEALGDALTNRLRLRNNLDNGKGLTLPIGSSLTFFYPSSYDVKMRINGYGDADNSETEDLMVFGH